MTDLFPSVADRVVGGVAGPQRRLRPDASLRDDRGSVLPLIIGFWLVAMLFVAGSIALGSAFTRQRSLQSTCDAAALAAASGVSTDQLHFGGLSTDNLPLGNAEAALNAFLARDPARASIVVDAPSLDADRQTVRIGCHRHTTVAFQSLIGRAGGIDQSARASARSPLD